MALLNGMYIHVTDEQLSRDVETTSHPVESGIPLTDTVRAKPFVISLSGKIVDYGDMKASEVLSKLNALKDSGSLIEYRGRNVAANMQIQSLNTTHPNTNHGGADFDMELKEVRIAKSAYVPKKSSTEKEKVAKSNKAAIAVGSTVVFKGGKVYVSSDAKKAAATRSRSTCKVTIISNKSYSVHKYHLISKDGKGVYGWVDGSNIEGVPTTSTSGKTNAGTQQVKKKSTTSTSTNRASSGETVQNIVEKYS